MFSAHCCVLDVQHKWGVSVCGIEFQSCSLEIVAHELKTVLLFVLDDSIEIKLTHNFF